MTSQTNTAVSKVTRNEQKSGRVGGSQDTKPLLGAIEFSSKSLGQIGVTEPVIEL